jgi:hypothetical protein
MSKKIDWKVVKEFEDITYKNVMALLELPLTGPTLEMPLGPRPQVNYIRHSMTPKRTPV